MHSKKQRTKRRRRARKLADQAWESVDDDNLDMAMKLIRRATDTHQGNPTIWNDRGLIHMLCDEPDEAAKAFHSAIGLTPDYAEPYAHLAGLAIQQRKVGEAARLIARAADLQPSNATYAELSEAYAAANTAELAAVESARKDLPPLLEDRTSEFEVNLQDRIRTLDWEDIQESLTQDGLAVLPRLLSEQACDSFRGMFDDASRFAKQVTMDKSQFGKGVYKYFNSPIPREIDALRQALYPPLARTANRWQELLLKEAAFPDAFEEFAQLNAHAGQTSPTPLLLKYGPGGFNAAHRDLRGEVFFPIQLAIVLSPHCERDGTEDGFVGGSFYLCDRQATKTKDAERRCVTLGVGDAVAFCTRERLVPFLDQYAIVPVSHGAEEVTAGERYVLAVPFHDYLP